MVYNVIDNWVVDRDKLPLFAGDTYGIHKDPKKSTKKILETMNQKSKVANYKVNKQKYVALIYIAKLLLLGEKV